MAYSGSTAASSVANPPNRIDSGLLSRSNINESTSVFRGTSLWTYHTTSTTTELFNVGYFTDAGRLGLVPGDIMIGHASTGQGSTDICAFIGVVHSSNLTGANLTSAGTITSTHA